MSDLDAVFVSFDEPCADLLYAQARDRFFPNLKRLHGVRGVGRAYALSARMVDTDSFVLIDGDCELADDFDVSSGRGDLKVNDVVVWQSLNPVNGLVYGYGGVKLCRTHSMRSIDSHQRQDVLTSVSRVSFLPVIGCTTRFNQSRFHSWRAGFRETTVLLRDDFDLDPTLRAGRLDAWLGTPFDVPYASWCAIGAQDALAAYEANPQDFIEVNDAASLRAEFSRRYL